MSVLNSLFDVVRGWPDESTIEEDFGIHNSVPANTPLTEGDILVQQVDGTMARGSGIDFGGAVTATDGGATLIIAMVEAPQLWLCVSGTTDNESDGQQPQGASPNGISLGRGPWKCVAIKGTYMVETQVFVTRAYVPGHTVTVVAGEVDLTDDGLAVNSAFQPYGEVRSYDATAGLLTVTVEN
jgi:hypothetical protein